MSSLFFLSESDLPDRTLHLRRIEFEKRRMRREIRRQKRRHGERDNGALLLERQRGGDRQPEADVEIMPEVRRLRCADGGWPFMEVSALPGGDFSSSDKGSWVHQPRTNISNEQPLFSGRRLQSGNRSISAFFPVKKERQIRRRSLMSGGEEGDSSSFPSLPPPPVGSPPPPPCPATPAHHREGTTLVQQPDKWGEKIPRLDLEDIWSDVTLPSQNGGAADLSQTSTQQDNHNQPSSPSRLPPQCFPPSSVRSVGCDTGDLVFLDSPIRYGDQGSRERIETSGGWVGDLSPLPEHQSSRSCRQPTTGGGLSVTGGGGLRRALSAELSSILR
jgi:hypothetical protein